MKSRALTEHLVFIYKFLPTCNTDNCIRSHINQWIFLPLELLVEKRVLISLEVDGRGDWTKVIVNYALFYTGDDKPAAHRQSCTKRIQWWYWVPQKWSKVGRLLFHLLCYWPVRSRVWDWVGVVSNCTMGLFCGTNLNPVSRATLL